MGHMFVVVFRKPGEHIPDNLAECPNRWIQSSRWCASLDKAKCTGFLDLWDRLEGFAEVPKVVLSSLELDSRWRSLGPC
jgi:hypothetical protein